SEVHASNHEVIHSSSGRRLGYGVLAQRAAKLAVPPRDSLRLKSPEQFRYIGKGQTTLADAWDIATGKAQYGIDSRADGMLFAVISRSPVLGGRIARVDSSAAERIPGVVKVIRLEPNESSAEFHPLPGIAVIAKDTWIAMKACKTLKIQWQPGSNGEYDSKS